MIDKNTSPDFQTTLNSLAIRLRSEDLHHLILGYRVPKLQGYHLSKFTSLKEMISQNIQSDNTKGKTIRYNTLKVKTIKG